MYRLTTRDGDIWLIEVIAWMPLPNPYNNSSVTA